MTQVKTVRRRDTMRQETIVTSQTRGGSCAPSRDIGVTQLATFWHGPPISSLDLAGLMSFRQQGFKVDIYSYEPVPGMPSDLIVKDASAILDRSYLNGFVVNGRPSLSHFSDLFRYTLFAKTEAAWIDTDLLCLRTFSIPSGAHFLTRETSDRLNGAILWLDRQVFDLSALVEAAASYANQADFPWGATGPRLITRILGPGALEQALDVNAFYPVDWNNWWKPFLPAYREECHRLCSESLALHLWNNIIDKAGFWKDVAPPRGSFLHGQLEQQGLLQFFRMSLPESVMKTLVMNYIHMQTGELIPLRKMTGIISSRLKKKVLAGLGS